MDFNTRSVEGEGGGKPLAEGPGFTLKIWVSGWNKNRRTQSASRQLALAGTRRVKTLLLFFFFLFPHGGKVGGSGPQLSFCTFDSFILSFPGLFSIFFILCLPA